MRTHRNTAVFSKSFQVSGDDETWPAGEYEFEAKFGAPWACVHSDAWKASVVVHLHPRTTPSGLTRSLTVSLADLDDAVAHEKESGKRLFEFVLEETLAEPIVRLMMHADCVSEADLRQLYPGPIGSNAIGRRNAERFAEYFWIGSPPNEGVPPWLVGMSPGSL